MKLEKIINADQQSEIAELISDITSKKIHNNLSYEDMFILVRDKLSYNQLLALSTLYVAEQVMIKIDVIQKELKKTI